MLTKGTAFRKSIDRAWRDAPCSGCAQEAWCARDEIACERFYYWVSDGKPHRGRPRVPTRAFWHKVFEEDPAQVS